MANDATTELEVNFETDPSQYRHWALAFEGPIARLSMNVREDGGLRPADYTLKLNSYDLGVDIELADAISRIRFEHPETRVIVITSLREKIFCAGANIFMLGSSSHPFKVNFCKFTNETRLSLEDAAENSGIKSIAALNGTASGGGYELALACSEILLIDDGNSAVSLPEVPLLGVLPGTGGLTRVVDKRKVRRDLADFFSTTAEGVRGKRAQDWNLVDLAVPRSKFTQTVTERAQKLAALSNRPTGAKGIVLTPLRPKVSADSLEYKFVHTTIDPAKRLATVTVKAPETSPPKSADGLVDVGAEAWAIRAFRELDDTILRIRMNHLNIGTIVFRTSGDRQFALEWDRFIAAHQEHWLVRETLHLMKRVLKRIDVTSKTLYCVIDPSSAFAGTLAELVLLSDRSYMLDDREQRSVVELGPLNAGLLPMANGLSRLTSRMLAHPERVTELLAHRGPWHTQDAITAGLVTFAPDELDWDDELRVAIEERASISPDALTGLESNLRFAGPETLETKIFGRLSAWQNWIFQRPNAVGTQGALSLYGQAGVRPTFDMRRT